MRNEKIKWDSIQKEIVVTQERRFNIAKAEDLKEAQQRLEEELRRIIQQVKALKARAEEIKSILGKLKEAEPADSAS